MNREAKQVAAEIREQNKLFEKGETDKAFWLAQQQRLLRIKELDPQLTQKQIGQLVGKEHQWVSKVLAWDSLQRESPEWVGVTKRSYADVTARQMRDPEKRKRALDGLTTDEQLAVAAEVMAKPEVAEQIAKPTSKAAKTIRKVAEDAEDKAARQRIKTAKEATAKRRGPTPLSQFFWRIVGEMKKWERDLKTISEEMHTLDRHQRGPVLDAHHALLARVQENIGLLEEGSNGAIEGRVVPRAELNR